jgi:hypothetical protein
MVEAVRGVVEPVRIATWCKPKARTKVQTTGWAWASVSVIAFKKGKALELESAPYLDHITAEPVMNGRRAELPQAKWPTGWSRRSPCRAGLCLDPFAGSGRYHGGKWMLAPWIIEHFPPHRIYTEAFGGAASVLMRKPRAKLVEVYNDLDGEIVSLFRVLRDPDGRRCEEAARS